MTFRAATLPFVLACVGCVVVGCGQPNQANIELRKQNQALGDQVAALTRERDAALAQVEGLREQQGTVPSLPTERLEKLFTTHSIQIGRLTAGAELDGTKPGDEGVKVYIVPFDQKGDEIKAAGSILVEAFDLAGDGDTKLGRWEFDTAKAAEHWIGKLLRYEYVLTCAWQTPPKHEEVTIKVTFLDELTGRKFTGQRPVKVKLPPSAATSPVTVRP